MSDTKLRQYVAYHRDSAARALATSRSDPAAALTISQLYDSAALAASVNRKLSRYMNVGYWKEDTTTLEQAGDNLMEQLVAAIVARTSASDPSRERILDVACGMGATTRYLCRRWQRDNIWGINISEAQLAICRQTAPGCHFTSMPATALRFEPESFDHVICVEAAFQFQTRADFLREAHRVLKPGGVLALSDILVIPEAATVPHRFSDHHPPANFCPSLDAYRDNLLAAGFGECEVTDITECGFRRYQEFSFATVHREWVAGRLTFQGLQRHIDALCLQECLASHVLTCIATR